MSRKANTPSDNDWECNEMYEVPWFPARKHPHSDTLVSNFGLGILSKATVFNSLKQFASVSLLLAPGPNNLQHSLSLWSHHLLPLTSNFSPTYQYFSEPFHFLSLSLLLTLPNTLVSVAELRIESISAFGWDMVRKPFPSVKHLCFCSCWKKLQGFKKQGH